MTALHERLAKPKRHKLSPDSWILHNQLPDTLTPREQQGVIAQNLAKLQGIEALPNYPSSREFNLFWRKMRRIQQGPGGGFFLCLASAWATVSNLEPRSHKLVEVYEPNEIASIQGKLGQIYLHEQESFSDCQPYWMQMLARTKYENGTMREHPITDRDTLESLMRSPEETGILPILPLVLKFPKIGGGEYNHFLALGRRGRVHSVVCGQLRPFGIDSPYALVKTNTLIGAILEDLANLPPDTDLHRRLNDRCYGDKPSLMGYRIYSPIPPGNRGRANYEDQLLREFGLDNPGF